MKGSAVAIVLLSLVLLALIALQWVILPDPSQRNFQFMPGMVESVPHDAQSPLPALPDGTVLDLRPPPGSVARGYTPLAYPATPEGALLAGNELTSPVADDDAWALERGAFVFVNFCVVCHGGAGNGDGPVAQRGVPPPPSLHAEHALEMTDGQMYHVISLGQANMASYASQVERADRWNVIHYIRSLQRSTLVAAAMSTPDENPASESTGPAGPTEEVQ